MGSAADLLRKLADVIDGHGPSPNQAVLTPVEVDHEDHTDHACMIPPLQQKFELIKQGADITNVYDDDPVENTMDQLVIIKNNAGL